jgi:hypothetical protein
MLSHYAGSHNYTHMLSVVMLSVIHSECIMLSVIHGPCPIYACNAYCCYAECRYA